MFNFFIFTSKYWLLYKSKILCGSFILDVFKWFGLSWAIIEPVSYFSNTFNNTVKPYGLWIFGSCIIVAIIENRPKLKFKFFIKEKDTYINIEIGDVLNQKERDLVIPTNVHFITEISSHIISEKSIQGQFTKQYYTNTQHLDSDIEMSLKGTLSNNVQPPFFKKEKMYSVGTVATLQVKKNKKSFLSYFFAMAKLNEHGTCQSDINEFQQALPQLWNYIQHRGSLGNIAMPILGSGFCRIDASREDLLKKSYCLF